MDQEVPGTQYAVHKRNLRRRRGFALVLLSLVLIACDGSDETGASIPRSDDLVSGGGGESAEPTTPRLSLEEATLQFTECMRGEGIDMPDIRLSADGRPILGDLSRRVDIADPAFQEALAVCSSILSEAGALDLSSDPELQALVQDQLQSFSECMRDNGIRQFPDPMVGFSGQGSPYPLGEIPFDAAGFTEAVEVCQQEIAFTGLQG